MTNVVVSGGFDPLHMGHLNMLERAKQMGDKLIVILNNDYWLKNKKGYNFQNQFGREAILEKLECVDEVFMSRHEMNDDRKDVVDELEEIDGSQGVDVFANGGDRIKDNTPEVEYCKKHDIMLAFNVGGGKVESSSELVRNAMKQLGGNDE